jgi:hypothetical protein
VLFVCMSEQFVVYYSGIFQEYHIYSHVDLNYQTKLRIEQPDLFGVTSE